MGERGRPHKLLEITPEQAAELAMRGSNAEQLQAAGLSKRDAETIRRVTKLTEEEFKEQHAAKLRDVLELLIEDIRTSYKDLSPAQKGVMYGILSDKLNAAPKSVTNALHLHLKGDRAAGLGALLGQDGLRKVGLVLRGERPEPTVPAGPGANGPIVDL